MDPEPSLAFTSSTDFSFVLGMVALVIFLVFSALLSGAEVAFFSLSQKEINELSQKKPLMNNLVAKLLSNPKNLHFTITIANYFTSLGFIVSFLWLCSGYQLILVSRTASFFLQLLGISFVMLLLGEILPKVYYNNHKLKLIFLMTYPLVFLEKLTWPIRFPMLKTASFFQTKFGNQRSDFSVDQLSQALEMTSIEETSKEEQKILEGIVNFGNTDTKQVMSPRIDLFALDINETFAEIYPKIVEKGYSRIPVYRDNIDRIEGVLFVKDLIPHINKKELDWKKLLREPFFVPENKKLDDLLKDFQSMKSHLAIVVDEYGGTSGIVSLEDVIEEIVGDISDEFDDDDSIYTKIDDKNYIFEGRINLKDFFRVIDADESLFEKQKGEAETLAGFILEVLGNFPKRRQKIPFENYIFTIESVDNKRIKQIKVTLNE